MNTALVTIIIYIFYSLPFIGVTQIVGSIIRALMMKDWSTPYGKGLKSYFIIVAIYALLFITVLKFDEYYQSEMDVIYPSLLVIAGIIAVYYWRIVYFFEKK